MWLFTVYNCPKHLPALIKKKKKGKVATSSWFEWLALAAHSNLYLICVSENVDANLCLLLWSFVEKNIYFLLALKLKCGFRGVFSFFLQGCKRYSIAYQLKKHQLSVQNTPVSYEPSNTQVSWKPAVILLFDNTRWPHDSDFSENWTLAWKIIYIRGYTKGWGSSQEGETAVRGVRQRLGGLKLLV